MNTYFKLILVFLCQTNNLLNTTWVSLIASYKKYTLLLRSLVDDTLPRNRYGTNLFGISPEFGVVAKNSESTLIISFNPDHSGMFNDALELYPLTKDSPSQVVSLTGKI